MKRIFPVVLALIAALSLAGCGAKKESGPKPEEVFDGYIAAVKAFDLAKAEEYLAEDASPDLMLDLSNLTEQEEAVLPALKVWLSQMEVSNVQPQVSGDIATITFDFAIPDMEAAAQKAQAAVATEETIMALVNQVQAEGLTSVEAQQKRLLELILETMTNELIKAIEDPEVKMVTQSGDAELVKTKAGWKLTQMWVDLDFDFDFDLQG